MVRMVIKAMGYILLSSLVTFGMIFLSHASNIIWFENKPFNLGELEGIGDVFEIIGFITVSVMVLLGFIYGVSALRHIQNSKVAWEKDKILKATKKDYDDA